MGRMTVGSYFDVQHHKKISFLQSFLTDHVTKPASYSVGIAFHFPAAKLTTYLHLVSWIRISGTILPLFHMISWYEFNVPNFKMRWINAD
jgi:hypothetical protein